MSDECTAGRCVPARDDEAAPGNATPLEHVARIGAARQRHLRTSRDRVQLDRSRVSEFWHRYEVRTRFVSLRLVPPDVI
jgi:hypothetical protein